jgi:hypothetical protein
VLALGACGSTVEPPRAKAQKPGPLRVLRANPRYFSDGRRAVYLTGSHVWWNFLGDRTWPAECITQGSSPFDYGRYLNRLARYHHNFFRLWTFEITRWRECGGTDVRVAPQPWLRTGPGTARDGLPKFDLTRLDPAYFRRLRNRVVRARNRGMYVSVMLFEGWSLQFAERPWNWAAHPFDAANNVNGVDGDTNHDGVGTEVHTLGNRRVLAIQRTYVRRVLRTLNDLNNVLYEIVNEAGPSSTRWQYDMIRFVKREEARMPKRHPVGMTYQNPGGRNDTLLASPADWISPAGGAAFLANPPPALPRVQLSDTDHHCGICGDATFPWKALTRGYNPVFMDPMDANPHREAIRWALGNARHYAERMDLASARPRPDLASTRFCLAVPGRQYLVYRPERGPVVVDLGRSTRRYRVEWFEPSTGKRVVRGTVQGGGRRQIVSPFAAEAVLFLH